MSGNIPQKTLSLMERFCSSCFIYFLLFLFILSQFIYPCSTKYVGDEQTNKCWWKYCERQREWNAFKVNRVADKDRGKEKYLQAMPVSSHSFWHSESALFATVFINRKINMAAALTPELEEPISGFTYKTGCWGRALLSAGHRQFSKGIQFGLELQEK